MGKWIYDTPVHFHDTPSGDLLKGKTKGCVWVCECKTMLFLESVSSSFDPRERETYYTAKWTPLRQGDVITLSDGNRAQVTETGLHFFGQRAR